MPYILPTSDGSVTLHSEIHNVTYHSINGAVTESMHVFIEMGLEKKQAEQKTIRILEMGLGTGLNAYLTFFHKKENELYYTALETNPISLAIAKDLNYSQQIENKAISETFLQIHTCEWEKDNSLSASFHLKKYIKKLQDFETEEKFDIIYYDAFDPAAQPELWTEAIFEKLYSLTAPNGILVTYCAKGSVRRAMQAAGYTTERLPGPPGKREMLRATKAKGLLVS